MLYRLSALLCCCLLVGCGEPQLYDVWAVVTLNGEPLAEAEVMLLPVREGGVSAFGVTDAEGMVVFKAGERVGGFSGTYIVTVSKTTEERRLTNNEIRALAEAGIRYRPSMVELVPERYTCREMSDLRVRIGYWRSRDWVFDLRAE